MTLISSEEFWEHVSKVAKKGETTDINSRDFSKRFTGSSIGDDRGSCGITCSGQSIAMDQQLVKRRDVKRRIKV